MCVHGTMYPAMPCAVHTPMHTHSCTAAQLHGCTCAALAHRQPCPHVCVLVASAKPHCAGMLGLEPQGAAVPGAIRSPGMLELAACWHVCLLYLPVMGRAVGASFAVCTNNYLGVTKAGMSKQLVSRSAHPGHTRTHARLQPGMGLWTLAGRAHPQHWGARGHTSTALHMCGGHTDIPVWWVCLASWLSRANAESWCGSCPTAVPCSRLAVPGCQHSVCEDPAAGSHTASLVLSQAPCKRESSAVK